MATIFLDGFDKYGSAGIGGLTTGLLSSYNTVTGANVSIQAGLSSTGTCIQFTDNQSILKTLGVNYSRVVGGFRFSSTLLSVSGITFTDAGSSQFSIVVNPSTGIISIRTGSNVGTTIGSPLASVASGTVHTLSWDVTVGASGSFTLWLDGVLIQSGTGNTRGGTANNQLNGFNFSTSGSFTTFKIDDFFLIDGTGSFDATVTTSNPRIETQVPTGDSQTQWTNVDSILGTVSSITGNTNAPGANQIFLRKFTSAVAQTINSVSIVPQATSAGAKFKAVIYPDSGGSPNGQAIMSSGTEVVGATSGTTLTGALVTPQSLSAATPYWIGFITDTSVVLQETDTTTTGVKAANTYTSGAPAICPTVTPGQNSWSIWGNCTGAATNWESVDLLPPPGDANSISSLTVGNEDLYSFPALTTTATKVFTVGVSGNAKLTGTGARTIDLRTKSSASDSAGSTAGQTPGASYSWFGSYFDTDPNGSITWTTTAVNAATAGPKVAS